MKAGSFIASGLRFNGRLPVVATAISFFVIIISVSISSGFRKEIRRAVTQVCGDVQVSGFESCSGTATVLEKQPGVVSVTPAVYAGAVVKSGDRISGVMFKGVEGLDSVSLGIIIPESLSSKLSVGVGDRLSAYFAGEKVKVRRFTILDVYESEYDLGGDEGALIYAPISDMRRVLGMGPDEASVLEVGLNDSVGTYDQMNDAAFRIGYATGLRSESAAMKYGTLFNWLELVDANVLAILVLMSVVAGFNMISGLLIMLFSNISTIGTLKALGMTGRSIAGVFLRVCARIVFKGMLIGNALALAFCLVQGTTHLIRLNPENYFVSFVPVALDVPFVLIADVAAFVLIMVMLGLPSLFISKVDPARTVRVKA